MGSFSSVVVDWDKNGLPCHIGVSVDPTQCTCAPGTVKRLIGLYVGIAFLSSIPTSILTENVGYQMRFRYLYRMFSSFFVSIVNKEFFHQSSFELKITSFISF